MTIQTSLYPDIEQVTTYDIEVGDGHCLYVEECGNPKGIPVVFLHGGPGSCCKPYHRSFFDPTRYRIILFDQRGSGRSQSHHPLKNNTSAALIADMEIIREKLSIDKWVVFGGSWGATLGLLYAQAHHDKVLGLIVRGTFLARKADTQWFYSDQGVARIYPQQWQEFTASVPEEARNDISRYYYTCLTKGSAEQAKSATFAWANWGGCVVSNAEFPALPMEEISADMSHEASIELHYVVNHSFIEDNEILNNVDKLAGIKGIIIHGQRDYLCPLESSYQLHQQWANSELVVLPESGHLANGDEAMIGALVNATDEMADSILS